jgi:hypothetical protein
MWQSGDSNLSSATPPANLKGTGQSHPFP